ncbi:hypothetical protein HKX48_006319 [Thoreauomyces humboldtii]|nr:hypothetical protein HKX48_006319 [Thoreauomyces humboldtii]
MSSSSSRPFTIHDIADEPLLASFRSSHHREILHLLHALLQNPNDLIVDRTSLLAGLVDHRASSGRVPFAALFILLRRFPRQWPIFQLIEANATLWKRLPEAAKAGHDQELGPLIHQVTAQVNRTYASLLDLLPRTTRPAIRDAQGNQLTHRRLVQFLQSFRIPGLSTSSTRPPIVAIALPNGTTLALAVLAVASYVTATPVNRGSGVQQTKSDILQSKANAVMVLSGDVDRLGLSDPWVRQHGISIILVDPEPDLTFSMRVLGDDSSSSARNAFQEMEQRWTPSSPDATAIVLFTSGTSGTKKSVPLTVASIVGGVAFVVKSWGLTANDVCLNQMPLNHVGGIVRNLFAPIMAGGSTVCCSAFDPNLFWDIVEDQSPTWYYASPSMHSMILEAVQSRPEARAQCHMRLVCNAAGGLLPSLAEQLRDTFRCTVLPSYGMTECMPISTPPLDYVLDRPGTSGISVGPEIAILDGRDALSPSGTVGRISVRGTPLFPGYLRDGSLDRTVFTNDGWFDTGDMGYLDADGYLYVTGRNKEVINRGGELISPFEIEEAIVTASADPNSPIYGRVSQALAFSVGHDVLQEVVGVVLVTPDTAPRADLRQLQEAVSSSLQQAKWPVVIVYMDDVPKNNNKVLRIRLAERFGIPETNDNVPAALRHYTATCPPPNSALTVMIPSSPDLINFIWFAEKIRAILDDPSIMVHVRPDQHDSFPEIILATSPGNAPSDRTLVYLRKQISQQTDGLYQPGLIHVLEEALPRGPDGFSVDEEALSSLLGASLSTGDRDSTASDTTESRVFRIVADILGCPVHGLSAETDFFFAGGDSLKAGRLLSSLRKEFGMRLPIDLLFTNPKLGSLSALIGDQLRTSPNASEVTLGNNSAVPLPGCKETRSSTNPFLLLVQLIPLVILYPLKRALTWTILVYVLSNTGEWSTAQLIYGRLANLLLAMAAGHFVTELVSPLVGIAVKWILIGKYKAGMYPMWGLYHTRWWLVQKTIQVAGLGHFKLFNWTRVLYYRLLGAHIGRDVTIDPGVTFGEYDLITIGAHSSFDRCVCRPFAAERNTSMYLGKINIGKNCQVGLASVVAAGSVLPDNTFIGPNSSSWETADVDPLKANRARSRAPSPNLFLTLFVTWPMFFFSRLIGALPWMLGLYQLVQKQPTPNVDPLVETLHWFAAPHRIAYHYLALVLNVSVGPVFLFSFVILIRKLMDLAFGRIKPSPVQERSVWTNWRMAFMQKLMSADRFREFVDLFGGHYEMTSVAVRALGGKVGRRVYWPGTGPSMPDFGLVEIGNDVVFGSRAHLITSDGEGSDYIKVEDRAMVSDRVVLLPGTTVGRSAVFGSGALARRKKVYPPFTTWLGSKRGEAVDLSKKLPDTPSPSPTDNSYEGSTSVTARNSQDTSRSDISLPTLTHDFQPHAFQGNHFQASNSNTTMEFNPHFSPHSSLSRNSESDVSTFGAESAQSFVMATYKPNYSQETEVVPGKPKQSFADLKRKRSSVEASTPFGRAFYGRHAPYYVLGQFPIFLYSIFIVVFVGFYWNVSSVSGVQLVAKLVADRHSNVLAQTVRERGVILYASFFGIMGISLTIQAILAILIVIAAKWILMGRRQAGKFDWDTSSYCQRWQVFLTVESLRRHCYGGHGILGLLTGTYYCTLYFRFLGATIGKDCSLFSGGLPSLMFTEPDLLTLGDRVSVDDASLVSHINSRGHFSLNPLKVGSRSVLRTGSRLLSGAQMGEDTCLLEHTLIMAGDYVEDGATMQGWPAAHFDENRVPTIHATLNVTV